MFYLFLAFLSAIIAGLCWYDARKQKADGTTWKVDATVGTVLAINSVVSVVFFFLD